MGQPPHRGVQLQHTPKSCLPATLVQCWPIVLHSIPYPRSPPPGPTKEQNSPGPRKSLEVPPRLPREPMVAPQPE
eukprot:1340725-Amphidinium_carterae.1